MVAVHQRSRLTLPKGMPPQKTTALAAVSLTACQWCSGQAISVCILQTAHRVRRLCCCCIADGGGNDRHIQTASPLYLRKPISAARRRPSSVVVLRSPSPSEPSTCVRNARFVVGPFNMLTPNKAQLTLLYIYDICHYP